MEIGVSIPDIQKTVNTDLHYTKMSEDFCLYALNMCISDFNGNEFVLQNEPSNLLCTIIPNNKLVIGYRYIVEQDRLLLFLISRTQFKNSSTCDATDIFAPSQCEIGEILGFRYNDNIQNTETIQACFNCFTVDSIPDVPLEQIAQKNHCNYRTIITSDCLNWNINYPIDIEYKITDCSLQIYFVDNYNEDRYIYLNYSNDDINGPLKLADEFKTRIGLDDCCNPIYDSRLNCNKIKFQPDMNRLCIEVVDTPQNGRLKVGAYQGFIAYADEQGNALTEYHMQTNPISIFSRKLTDNIDYITSSSITFQISNQDIHGVYRYYNLAILSTIKGVQNVEYITLPIEQDKYTYTGFSTLKSVSIQELFANKVYYKQSLGITKSNNYLFRFGVTEYNKPNLQRVANLIKMFWATTQVPETAYFNAKNTEKYRTYQRDEVVPIGIIFEADNGEDFPILHIPNYTTTYYQERYGIDITNIVTNGDAIIQSGCDTSNRKYWEVYNTANVLAQPHQPYKDCEETCWEWGEFGYWESTEKYPNLPEIWGDLCGKPIRFPKMPDSCVSHIHDSLAGYKTFDDSNMIFPIGIRVDHNNVRNALQEGLRNCWIKQEDYDRIKSYRIVRADRVGNKSVVAKGHIYNVNEYEKNGKKYSFPNFPYNDLRANDFLTPDKDVYITSDIKNYKKLPFNLDTKKYTFHSPDIHFTDPSLGNYIKLETEEYGESEGFFEEARGQAEYKFITTFSATLAFATGLAAYLSASEVKECTTYTIKSCSKETQEKKGFNYVSATPSSGDIITGVTDGLDTGDVSQTGDNVLGLASNNLVAGTGRISIRPIKKDTSVGERKQCFSNPYNTPEGQIQTYDKLGNKTSPESSTAHGGLIGSIVNGAINDGLSGVVDSIRGRITGPLAGKTNVESYTQTSCYGTTESILEGRAGNDIIKTFFTILGKAKISRVILAMQEIRIVRDLIMSLSPYKNFALQYNSVGKYNNYKCVKNNTGNKIRSLDFYGFVRPEIESIQINGKSELFNNWNRESGILLQVKETLPSPSVIDNSRFLASEVMSGRPYDYNLFGTKYRRNISAYYASIKNTVPNQYGSIQSIRYLETGRCSYYLDRNYDYSIVFGGDTYINRFAHKIKHPFFTQTRFKGTDGADVRYQTLGNAAYPAFYFNTEGAQLEDIGDVFEDRGILALLSRQTYQSALNVPKNNLDIDNSINTIFYQRGYIYLYTYGIPYFLVESDVNVDYRHGKNTKEDDYYPRVSDINEWLQEDNVPITFDNTYFYNPDYSTSNSPSTAIMTNNLFQPNRDCKVQHTQRLIYSDRAPELQSNNSFDSWLVNKASNQHTFDLDKGKLISVDGIENTKILCRFEHGMAIHNAYVTISTNLNVAQIDNNRLFQTNPQQFADTNLGYIGTQHRVILKTEFGHIWVDAKRGQIFILGNNASGLDEISKNGTFHWFKENLPFEIAKQFPKVNIDNNLKGIGLALCFDKRFRRIFVTKLDYKPIVAGIQYDEIYHEFYVIENNLKKIVSVSDTRYFCNKSWTRAYSLLSQTWISFYSFIPNYYIDGVDKFSSGINSIERGMSSLWTHNLTNKSYQVFYGKLYPFIIELNTKFDLTNKFICSVEYACDVLRYHNEFDYAYINNVTYNKAIISNTNQTSGILELDIVDINNEYVKSQYPIRTEKSHKICVTKTDNHIWSFNQFKDVTRTHNSNLPMLLWNCANSQKSLNLALLNYNNNRIDDDSKMIRKDNCSITFINDMYSNYKFLHKFTLNLNNRSIH